MSKSKYNDINFKIKKKANVYRRLLGRDFSDICSDSWDKLLSAHQDVIREEQPEIDGNAAECISISIAQATIDVAEGVYHSIYLDDESLVRFLSNSKPGKNTIQKFYSDVRRLVNRCGSHSIAIRHKGCGSANFLHFDLYRKMERDSNSFKESDLVVAFSREDLLSCVFFSGDTPIQQMDTLENEDSLRLLVNLMAYIECFPNKVLTGPPKEEIRHAGHFGALNVRADKKIITDDRSAKTSPHLRRGHMRLLTHERYGENAGKWVYVRPTMVKGTAETVMH